MLLSPHFLRPKKDWFKTLGPCIGVNDLVEHEVNFQPLLKEQIYRVFASENATVTNTTAKLNANRVITFQSRLKR